MSREGPSQRLLADLTVDLLSAAGGSVLAAGLLWYLHGAWQPGRALICGIVSGILLRRAVRPSYATFPSYLRRPLGIGVVLLGTIVAAWATMVREPSSYWLLRWREAVTLPILAAALGVGLAGVIYSHARMRREIEEARARAAALREENLRARLRALQAQINPHFLFNAFNALAELTHDDPAVAEQLVGDLAHLLRYSLRSSAEGVVSLAQELEAVRRYLRVETARLGDRLAVEEWIDADALDAPLPGLLLQPLVENAVQHGVATRTEGGLVTITAKRSEEGLHITVQDDGPGLPDEVREALERASGEAALRPVQLGGGTAGAGGGLANVVQRLALRYRGAARIEVFDSDPGTRVELRIPA